MSPPTEIRWGTAWTAAGALGVAPRSDWARGVADGRLPWSGDGAGFGVDFATDLELLAGHGLTTMRWTLDWARLEPMPGRWDTDAADLVAEVLRAARRAGVEVWAVLHDGPLPGWFADDEGGLLDEAGRARTWPRHVDRVAEAFGDLVAAWVPVLDPFAQASQGWLLGRRPPWRADPVAFTEALEALHLASHEAWRLLRSGEPPVVAGLDPAPVHPGVTSREPDEREEARRRASLLERLRGDVWLRALQDGVVGVPGRAEIELDGLAGGYDLVGFTYRGAVTAYADGSTGPYPADAVPAPDGRAPWPEGLGVTARRLADELPGRPLALLGTGLTAPEDDRRTEVLRATALEIDRARADGVPLGVALWETGIDAWTPECGLDVATGVFDRSRQPRPSASELAALAGRARLER